MKTYRTLHVILFLSFLFPSCGGGGKLVGDAGTDRSDVLDWDEADLLPDSDAADLLPDSDAADGLPDVDVPDVDAPDVDADDTVVSECPAGSWAGVIFEFQADERIVSTPAIGDDGTIYFGTENATFYAVDCYGGKKWEWKYDCEEFCPQAFEGSPAIGNDGTIYIGDDISIPNYFFALTPGGEMIWEYETSVVYGQMDASPAIADDGTLFVGSHGESGYVGPIGELVALDPEGNVLGGFPVNTGAIFSSPAVMRETLFVGETGAAEGPWYPLSNRVFAVSKEGEILWRITVSSTGDAHAYLGLSSIAIDEEGNIVVADNHGEFSTALPHSFVVLLDPSTGRVIRTIQVSSESTVVGAPVIGDTRSGFGEDIIVALENGRLVSFNPHSGGLVITFDIDLGESSMGSPVLGDDGMIYAAADNMLWQVTKSGEFTEEFNPFEVSDTITSSLAMGPGGILYFGTEGGKLIAVSTDAGGLDPSAPWPSFRHDRRNTGNGD